MVIGQRCTHCEHSWRTSALGGADVLECEECGCTDLDNEFNLVCEECSAELEGIPLDQCMECGSFETDVQ